MKSGKNSSRVDSKKKIVKPNLIDYQAFDVPSISNFDAS